MAAQTVKEQIEELVGSTTSVAALDDWAGDAINKLILTIPEAAISPFASAETETYPATAVTVKGKRILQVYRKPASGSALNRRCRYIPSEEYNGELADSNSMYYPTSYDPVYSIYGDTIVVLPTVSGMIITVRKVALISPATFDTTGTAISSLPEECEFLVVLDVAARVARYKIQSISLAALTISASAPSAPSLSTVLFVDGTAGSVTPTSISALPSVPTYNTITFPTGFATAATAFDTAMTNEDLEVAQTQIVKMKEYIDQFASQVQENLGAFQIDVEDHKLEAQRLFNQAQGTLQEAISNAQRSTEVSMQAAVKDMEAIIANNEEALQKYQQQIASYAQSVNDEVSEYQSNIARNKLEVDRYSSIAAALKQEYYDRLNQLYGMNIPVAYQRINSRQEAQ